MALTSPTVPGPTLSAFHWGVGEVVSEAGAPVLRGWRGDPSPSPILDNVLSAARDASRVTQPHVRRGWLEQGPGRDARRGDDSFVPVDWPQALDLVAGELKRVYAAHGSSAVFGGSYGWSSAGRFHHAQSQVHRFLNAAGGYVRSVNTYSSGASEVLWPYLFGIGLTEYLDTCTTWDQLEETELFLCFGGLAAKNSAVAPGGVGRHRIGERLAAARRRGARFVLVSPLADDLPEACEADWLAIRPGTDTALILALCHELVANGCHDQAFLARYTSGADEVLAYLTGAHDGIAKSAAWAQVICGVPAARIRQLARDISESRSFINVSFSLQRARHGEHAVWAALTLAAFLGSPGKPSQGFGHGYGAFASIGERGPAVVFPSLDQGRNSERAFIPVARFADCLLRPGTAFDYNGERWTYPRLRLVYWAGGNPFHHHAELAKLRRALAEVDTLVVHEQFWTATARHADIVLPATLSVERNDIGATRRDPLVVAMKQILPPIGQARDDYDIFIDLARRLGCEAQFSQGLGSDGWLRHLYGAFRDHAGAADIALPDFDTFWQQGWLELPEAPSRVFLSGLVASGGGVPLPTPSGRIELFSPRLASYGHVDAPGHAAWLAEPDDDRGHFPLTLLANQPSRRLHSQLDVGACSRAGKIAGREPLRMNPDDAQARGLNEGKLVRVSSATGSLIAGLKLDTAVSAGTVQLSTGAWLRHASGNDGSMLCVAGTANAVTRDLPVSRLTQAAVGALTPVEVSAWSDTSALAEVSETAMRAANHESL